MPGWSSRSLQHQICNKTKHLENSQKVTTWRSDPKFAFQRPKTPNLFIVDSPLAISSIVKKELFCQAETDEFLMNFDLAQKVFLSKMLSCPIKSLTNYVFLYNKRDQIEVLKKGIVSRPQGFKIREKTLMEFFHVECGISL